MRNLTCLTFFLLSILFSIIHNEGFSQKTMGKPEGSYVENLILNTDRELYIAGEKIWFKVSCAGSKSFGETIISKIAYLELYDHNTNTITKGKFRIVNGIATGFLDIPAGISSGNYFLRAYTQFLRNYSPYLYAGTMVTVLNPDKDTDEAINTPNDDILIVPEGGKLIAGISSKIAIRLDPKKIKNIRKSVITNSIGDTLFFKPAANGLAMVEFVPESNAQYVLKLILDNGDSLLRPLPAVLNTGIVLHSDYASSYLKISLLTVAKAGSENPADYNVEIKSQEFNTLSIKKIRPGEVLEISETQLGQGIIYILLKNGANEIIDISSKYIPNKPLAQIAISKNKEVFKSGEMVELDIRLPENTKGSGSYLVSAVKAGTNSILEGLLPVYIAYNPIFLTNYLKSSDSHNDSLRKQIDIALLLYSTIYNTAGFRKDIQQHNELGWLPETRDISISGKVINKQTKVPVQQVIVYAAVLGDNDQMHMYSTNAEGEFFFNLNHLTGKQQVYIASKPVDSLKLEILIDNDFSTEYPYSGLIPMTIDSSDRRLLEQLYRNAQVSKAFINHAEKIEDSISYYPLKMEGPLYSVWLKDFIEIPVMSEIFDEIIPNVFARKKNDRYYLTIFDDKNQKMLMDPLVMLDNIPVFDMNEIMKISPELIERIDVTNKLCYLGDFELDGIINIKSRTENFAGIAFPDESVFLEYQTVTTETYPVFPEYGDKAKNNRIPDFRNLLYWDPYLSPANGKTTIKFFTPDNRGEFEIIVEGTCQDKILFGRSFIKVD